MALKQTLEVEFEDGSTQVVIADGRDFRAWEAWREQPIFAAPTSLTKLTEFAYLAGRRAGIWNGKYEDWEPTVVDVTPQAEEAPNPTLTDLGDDSSSPSRSEPTSASGSGKKQGKQRS